VGLIRGRASRVRLGQQGAVWQWQALDAGQSACITDLIDEVCSDFGYPAVAQSFSAWKERKAKVARRGQEQAQAERRRKGVLTGREIFSEVRTLWARTRVWCPALGQSALGAERSRAVQQSRCARHTHGTGV
jgi:hypothetical protein